MNLYELYDYAVDQGIDVDWYALRQVLLDFHSIA